jgi:hypothetical protein
MLIVPFLVMATYFLGKEVPKDGLRLRLTCNWQPRQPPLPSAGAPCRRPPFRPGQPPKSNLEDHQTVTRPLLSATAAGLAGIWSGPRRPPPRGDIAR